MAPRTWCLARINVAKQAGKRAGSKSSSFLQPLIPESGKCKAKKQLRAAHEAASLLTLLQLACLLPCICLGVWFQVFMPWEGVAAQRAGIELNAFKLSDYGIPYCYSPVLAAHPQTLSQNTELVKAFLAATAKGFEYAAQNPAEAAELLCQQVAADVAQAAKPLPEPLDPAMVAASQQVISQHYVDAGSNKWGRWVPAEQA